MKKELREEIKNDHLKLASEGKNYFTNLKSHYQGIAITAGVASFAALASYSVVKYLKQKNLAKKKLSEHHHAAVARDSEHIPLSCFAVNVFLTCTNLPGYK